MPEKPSTDLDSRADQELVSELSALRRELLGHERSSARHSQRGIDIIIFRFVYGMPPEKWTALITRPDLAGWLSMTVREDAHTALRRMQATLDDLSHAAGHDDLTGLARRDVFERSLRAEMERSKRTRTSLSLAIIDIDDFKLINDTCGHVHGDKVLRAFSDALRENVRASDLCARYGGEEFALIMPATTMLKAEKLLKRLMAVVRALKTDCPNLDCDRGLTCSIGLACYKGLGQIHPTDFLEMADQALYLAKNKGKDRLEKAPFKDIAPDLSEQTLVEPDEKTFLFQRHTDSTRQNV